MTGMLLDHASTPGNPHPAQKLSVWRQLRVVSADRNRSGRGGGDTLCGVPRGFRAVPAVKLAMLRAIFHSKRPKA
jgi:hypothetical protein